MILPPPPPLPGCSLGFRWLPSDCVRLQRYCHCDHSGQAARLISSVAMPNPFTKDATATSSAPCRHLAVSSVCCRCCGRLHSVPTAAWVLRWAWVCVAKLCIVPVLAYLLLRVRPYVEDDGEVHGTHCDVSGGNGKPCGMAACELHCTEAVPFVVIGATLTRCYSPCRIQGTGSDERQSEGPSSPSGMFKSVGAR